MKNKRGQSPLTRKQIALQVLVGVVVVVVFFAGSARWSVSLARENMANTAENVKEQCNRYVRVELASETKSLMRIIEGCNLISQAIQDNYGEIDEGLLRNTTIDSHLSGILLLDNEGKINEQYNLEGEAPEVLIENLKSPALLDTYQYENKKYTARYACPDGSEVDMAAKAMADGKGIIVAYYHTPEEYISSFRLSVPTMLTGYVSDRNSTIVVTDGDRVIASNEESYIGLSVKDIKMLEFIRTASKRASKANPLFHYRNDNDTVFGYCGLMEKGRDEYVYVYMPAFKVIYSALIITFGALIIYIVIISVMNSLKRRTAQRYREEKEQTLKEYTQQLHEKNTELVAALEEADRANAAKTGFLSRMSHDMRTPLNGIIGLMEINDAHPDDDKLIEKNHKKMRIAADHLLSLINDTLQMSKLESGEVNLAHDVINLDLISQDIITIVEQRAAEAGVTMEYDNSSDAMSIKNVYGSPLHLRQIFLNIYTNCIKYNKVGGKVRTHIDFLGVEGNTVTYRWIISDTGRGISEEFLKHIFDPFTQEKSDARSVYHGTGLGMSIVKGLLKKMNGTIEITSKEGIGTTFDVTIPFEIGEEEAAKRSKINENNNANVDISGLNILLVEDNELNMEIAKVILSDEGASITTAENGMVAIDKFKNSEEGSLDIILMDVMMPEVDGLAATRAIRALDRADAKTIPIIAMTANAFDEDVKKCLEAGMNAHIPKPFNLDYVRKKIFENVRKSKM